MTVSEASHSTTKQRDWNSSRCWARPWSGRMSPELSPAKTERTSERYSKKQPELWTTPFLFLDLREKGGICWGHPGRSILRRWRVLDARLCSAEHNFLNVKLRKMLSHLLKCSKASKNAPAGFTLSIICPSRKNEVHHHSDGRPHS